MRIMICPSEVHKRVDAFVYSFSGQTYLILKSKEIVEFIEKNKWHAVSYYFDGSTGIIALKPVAKFRFKVRDCMVIDSTTNKEIFKAKAVRFPAGLVGRDFLTYYNCLVGKDGLVYLIPPERELSRVPLVEEGHYAPVPIKSFPDVPFMLKCSKKTGKKYLYVNYALDPKLWELFYHAKEVIVQYDPDSMLLRLMPINIHERNSFKLRKRKGGSCVVELTGFSKAFRLADCDNIHYWVEDRHIYLDLKECKASPERG